MLRTIRLSSLTIVIGLLMGCDNTHASKSEIEHSVIDDAVIHDAAPTYKTVEWTDLIPKSDLDALLNPPEYLDDIADGSFEDIISNQVVNAISSANDDRYQQALISTIIITKMVDQPIRIPGFIVPLEFDDQQNITQFFLVPYFGACIHMPPPPPNQMIFVSSSLGISSNDLYDPFWITGILKTAIIENELGTAAYTMQITTIERYTEEE